MQRWRDERDEWMRLHPEPHDEAARRDYYERFPQRLQQWLDAGIGSCVLALSKVRNLVVNALRHFDTQRYHLDEFVVASNHVHALVTPLAGHSLSDILHSWKSFTAHEILKVTEAPRLLSESKVAEASRLCSKTHQRRDAAATFPPVWQKESFDHIVRSPVSLEQFRAYIRSHSQSRDRR